MHHHLVVTGAKSRTHLVHIAAYVRRLLDDSSDATLTLSFVPTGRFLTAPAVTLDDARAVLPHDGRLRLVGGMPGWRFDDGARAVYVSVGAPGLRTLAPLRRANGRRRIRIVVTDEGIGTYGSWATRRDALTRQGIPAANAGAKAALLVVSSRVLTSRRWAAYRRMEDGWSVCPDIADEFRRHTGAVHPGTSSDAIILTQPFVDLALVSEQRYVAYVEQLVESARSVGLEPVVRPHPAENAARYAHLPLMAGRGVAELDPAVVGAAAVIGGPSTALVNLASMHGAHVVWVSEPSLGHLDTDVSQAQREIFATFLGQPAALADVSARLR